MDRMTAVIGVVLLVVAVAGCGGAKAEEVATLVGTVQAPACGGGWQITNANVEVTNEDGTLVGVGTTGQDTHRGPGCRVSFAVNDVHKADFYRLGIGSHKAPSYSYDDLKARNFKIALTLGGGIKAAQASKPKSNAQLVPDRRSGWKVGMVEAWLNNCTFAACECVIEWGQRLYTPNQFLALTKAIGKPRHPLYAKWTALSNRKCD